MPASVKIEKIEDLFFVYNQLEQSLVANDIVEIALDDFLDMADISFAYEDRLDRLHGHVDSDIAQAIIDFQEYVYSLYKMAKYQDQDIPLSIDEENMLKIFIKIEDGSSKLKLFKAIAKAVKDMTKDMTAPQKIVFIVSILTVITTGLVGWQLGSEYIEHLNNQEETARIEAITSGYEHVIREVQSNPLYTEKIRQGQTSLLKPVKKHDSLSVKVYENGEEIAVTNQAQAKVLLKQERNRSITDVITSHYFVKSAESLRDHGKFKIKIEDSSSGVYGIIDISIDDDDVDFVAVMNHFGNKTPIKLVTKTKTLNGVTSIIKILSTLEE